MAFSLHRDLLFNRHCDCVYIECKDTLDTVVKEGCYDEGDNISAICGSYSYTRSTKCVSKHHRRRVYAIIIQKQSVVWPGYPSSTLITTCVQSAFFHSSFPCDNASFWSDISASIISASLQIPLNIPLLLPLLNTKCLGEVSVQLALKPILVCSINILGLTVNNSHSLERKHHLGFNYPGCHYCGYLLLLLPLLPQQKPSSQYA